MPISAESLAPPYLQDFRGIVARAFAEPEPVAAVEMPGGAVPGRLEAWGEWSSEELIPPPTTGDQAGSWEAQVGYWVRTIPHRVIIIGPLFDVAEQSLPQGVRRTIEREMLRTYFQLYDALPLSPELLELIARQEDAILLQWLEAARRKIMRSRTLGDAFRNRAAFRANALQHGAAGAWKDTSTASAGLLADVFLLLRAVREDVDRAIKRAIAEDVPVGAALRIMDDEEEWAFERSLAHLTRGGVTRDDFEPPEQEAIDQFARNRTPLHTLLASDGGSADPRSTTSLTRGACRSEPSDEKAGPPEDPRAEFRRILNELEGRIIGRPQLCRDLALVGVAAVCGVERQRVLLCGPTGSGKSHSAQALAESLGDGRRFMRIHCPDLVSTGFRGGQINDVLHTLATSAGDTLEGACVFLDELDKTRLTPNLDGNSRAAAAGRMQSLMALLDGSPVTLDSYDAEQLQTKGMLVIGAGAFEGRFSDRPPTTEELEDWGWMTEFAARWTTRLVLSPPGVAEARALLRSSDRSVRGQLGPLLDALGMTVEVPEATIRYAVHQWTRLGTDLRSASAWLAAAARRRIIAALEGDGREIVLTPDDLQLPLT